MEPMPYLLVIVDEFVQLIATYEGFLALFVKFGRVGRSLGIHMMLATQHIEAGCIRNLESHLRYRIGLRTLKPDESMAVIGRPDAYYLPPTPGAGYFKVDEDIYAGFKAALISVPYVPPEKKAVNSLNVICEFTSTGHLLPRQIPMVLTEQKEQKEEKTPTELNVAIKRIRQATEPPGGWRVHTVWQPPLDVHVVLATNLWSEFRSRLRTNMDSCLELRLHDPGDSQIDRQLAATLSAAVPGRGLHPSKQIFQVALPVEDMRTSSVRQALENLVLRMATSWQGPRAPHIFSLPQRVTIEEMLVSANGQTQGIPIGLKEFRLGLYSILILALPELLGGNTQRPVKFARGVFPGNDLGQFDERVLIIELAQTGEESITDLAPGDSHGIGILQGDALDFAVEWTRGVIGQGEKLLIRETQTAAHGSVDVLSKLATVEPGYAPIDQCLQWFIDQSRGCDPRPHGPRATKDGRPSRVHQVVEQRRSPYLCLSLQNFSRILINLFRVDPVNSRHESSLLPSPLQGQVVRIM